jgi:hypothetical protein
VPFGAQLLQPNIKSELKSEVASIPAASIKSESPAAVLSAMPSAMWDFEKRQASIYKDGTRVFSTGVPIQLYPMKGDKSPVGALFDIGGVPTTFRVGAIWWGIMGAQAPVAAGKPLVLRPFGDKKKALDL